MVTVYEAQLINQRLDDFHTDFKDRLDAIVLMIAEDQKVTREQRKHCDARLSRLEHFKIKIMTYLSITSALVGVLIGKWVL